MKLSKYLMSILSVMVILSFNVMAQEQEMDQDQWEAEMNRLRTEKQSLTSEVTSLQSDVNNLKTTNSNLQSYEDCVSELYSMVGATNSDVDNFRKAAIELQGKIQRREGPKADRAQDLSALQHNKISALPEFFNRVHNQMQASLDSWVEEPKEINYTVVKGDYLWKIAKMKEHYGNGFAWPMIYKANRDKIKNPDLIYPKQVFRIPKLTEEEKAKYEKLRMNYKPAPVQ